jgi:hypothetical protein
MLCLLVGRAEAIWVLCGLVGRVEAKFVSRTFGTARFNRPLRVNQRC